MSSWNRQADTEDDVPPSDVPPAPLLVYRSSSVLVFKAATFKPKSGEKVCFFSCRSEARTITSLDRVRI